jgi:hypothetical protein
MRTSRSTPKAMSANIVVPFPDSLLYTSAVRENVLSYRRVFIILCWTDH